MTARDTLNLDPRIALCAGLVAAFTCVSTLLAAAPQDAPAGVEIRTVSPAAQPCLNLRESPSYRARIIGCIEIDSELMVSGEENGWSRVSTQSEGQGWVGTRLLGPPSAAARAPEPEAETASDPEPSSEAEGPTAERDSLAEQLSAASVRIADLEEELTRRTLAEDRDASVSENARAELERLRVRLAVAEQRTVELETEALERASLAETVTRLTAERDLLATDLARAEARQLYLQSDLETTRAELMQLKGIPPKLVAPRQEPAAVALPPVAPESPAPEPTLSPTLGENREADLGFDLGAEASQVDAVMATVRAWAEAWSSQRVDDYLAFYAPGFRPADGQDRSSWDQSRRERIAAPRSIEIALDRVSPTVSASNAIVLFQQTYVSDSFTDVVDKTLVLERIDGVWRIVEERANG